MNDHALIQLLAELVHEVRDFRKERHDEFEWSKSHCGFATKHDLEKMETRIMSAISEFAAKQTAFNARIDTAIEALTADVQGLNDKIEELQNTPGPITPEDQALLDDLQARGEVIAGKIEALDAQTPPKPPVG